MHGLLLLFLFFGADTGVVASEIELKGAEEMELLCKAKRDAVLVLFRDGVVSEDRHVEAQRVALDASLKRETFRRAVAIAKGGKEPLVTEGQIDILQTIERLEARRLQRTRAAHKASLVSTDVVERAVLRHQLAWIENNFSAQLAKEGADQPALEKRKKQAVAKVRLRTAEKLVTYFEKTKPGSDELFVAQAKRIRASTAFKLANISKQ